MQIRPTAFTIGLIIYSFIALFCVYTESGIDSFHPSISLSTKTRRYDRQAISACLIILVINEIIKYNTDDQFLFSLSARNLSIRDIISYLHISGISSISSF